LAIVPLGFAGEPDTDPTPDEVERLVAQLGSDVFVEREAASRTLRDLAELALPPVRRRLNDPDIELRRRAIELIDIAEKRSELIACRGHEGEVLAVILLPAGRQAISAGADKTVRLWDLADGREVRRFAGHTEQVWCLALTPDGKQIASGGQDRMIRRWDVQTGQPLAVLPALPGSIRCLAYTPDGKTLVAACFDNRIYLIDIDKGRVRLTLAEQPDSVLSLAISADGQRALSGGGFYDCTVRLWDLGTGEQIRKMVGHDERISGVAFLPGDRAVSAAQDRTIRIWDLKTGKELGCMSGHTGPMHSLAVNAAGTHILTGAGFGDHSIRVWDVQTREELRRYTGHERAVCGLAITGDGKQFVSVSSDKTLRLWNMPRIRRK
jgi:WD40 repeat protein